ncbi:odorant receptor Or2-like [Cylas formicarius]|uniref:odorant receptor Or2-like n=1 Tax=Cylas formicarius TaxID=197179 RepID=UPI002958BDE4|nr:odorant receptor Or2-like [Cylas formicarius]
MLFIKFVQLFPVEADRAIECLSMLTIVFLLTVKMAVFQKKGMRNLLNQTMDEIEISSHGDSKTKKIILIYTRYSNRLNIIITVYSFSVGIHLLIMGIFEYQQFQQIHPNCTEICYKPLQVLYWYPFDTDKYYGIVIFYQAFSVLFSDLYNSATQALFNTIMIALTAQLKSLQHHFSNSERNVSVGNEQLSKNATKRLIISIQKHQSLISFTEELNISMKSILLVEYIISSLMIASIVIQVFQGKRVFFNIHYGLALSYQMFALAWNANEIREESQNLSNAVYESQWYNRSETFKKLVLTVILRAQKPLSLKIGPFGSMTADVALSRVKVAYTYVSLMSGEKIGS